MCGTTCISVKTIDIPISVLPIPNLGSGVIKVATYCALVNFLCVSRLGNFAGIIRRRLRIVCWVRFVIELHLVVDRCWIIRRISQSRRCARRRWIKCSLKLRRGARRYVGQHQGPMQGKNLPSHPRRIWNDDSCGRRHSNDLH